MNPLPSACRRTLSGLPRLTSNGEVVSYRVEGNTLYAEVAAAPMQYRVASDDIRHHQSRARYLRLLLAQLVITASNCSTSWIIPATARIGRVLICRR